MVDKDASHCLQHPNEAQQLQRMEERCEAAHQDLHVVLDVGWRLHVGSVLLFLANETIVIAFKYISKYTSLQTDVREHHDHGSRKWFSPPFRRKPYLCFKKLSGDIRQIFLTADSAQGATRYKGFARDLISDRL